jgi:2,3-bisphosphoglycerate-dependent phosphoglycerate mutase
MELILVRHALPERVENVEGVADPGLQPLGWAQARRLADWLGREHIDHIAVSPKRRAVETAAPLAERLGLEPEIIAGFSEIDRSSRTYIPVEEMRRENNEHWQALMRGDWASVGYHDPAEFHREVVAARDDLLARYAEQRVVVVAHGGTINAIVSEFLGFDTPRFVFDFGYTSITRAGRGYTDRIIIRSLNEMAHLHAERDSLEPLTIL